MLLGFIGLAVDGGRFYAERQFLQQAADAGALACASKLVSGGTPTAAADVGKALLRDYNLRNDPTGTTVTVSETPVFTTWYNAQGDLDKRNLYDGVYAGTTDCRVALQARMKTLFMVMLGFTGIDISAYAHAAAKGGMLPVVVNRYKDSPGPSSTFRDYSKQEAYQLANPTVCSENDGGNCPNAAESPITCTSGCLWGPAAVIAGQGYDSSDSDFRGFIALDIRDFTNAAHDYYNGTLGMNTNSLKEQEASYVKGGYPGPDLITYIPNSDPVQPGLQIATMAGNSSGVLVSNFDQFYKEGDKILIQYFDGQVREIPDFTIDPPSSISAATPSGPANGPTFRVGANQRFRNENSWVLLRMVRDEFADGNDTPAALQDFTFNPGGPGNGFKPAGGAGTQVQIQQLQVNSGAVPGIYSVIIEGTGYAWPNPGGATLKTHRKWVPLNIAGVDGPVTKDFGMNFTATTVEAVSGVDAVYQFTLTTNTGTSAWGTGAVAVAIDRGTCVVGNIALVNALGATVCGSATITASPDFVPKKTGSPTVTVTIPTGALGTGTYSFVLRARGTNGSGQPVVHVQQLTLLINSTSGGATKYVNIQGYGVFLITEVDANSVLGRAISGYYANPNDPALNIARRPGLIPWEVAPY